MWGFYRRALCVVCGGHGPPKCFCRIRRILKSGVVATPCDCPCWAGTGACPYGLHFEM